MSTSQSRDPLEHAQQILRQPRNPWTRFLVSAQLAQIGHHYEARRVLDTLTYKDELSQDIVALYRNLLARLGDHDATPSKINIPSDYLRGGGGPLHARFKVLNEHAKHPSPYPFGLVLPGFEGARNDTSFIEAYAAAHDDGKADLRVDVVYVPSDLAALDAMLASIEAQSYPAAVRLHVFAPQDVRRNAQSSTRQVVYHDTALPGPDANRILMEIALDTDIIVFTSGSVVLDETALLRIAHIARVSDNVIQALVPMPEADLLATPYTSSLFKKKFARSYPFRDILGLNFAITAHKLRQVRGFDKRFVGSFHAARELCFRLYNKGAYIHPVAVPRLDDFHQKEKDSPNDSRLFKALCPNHFDRKKDAVYSVPKVSIYIPAYNAGAYIVQAVESVLEQNFEDLEVCISDDGSTDNTLEILQKHYGENKKVRWQSKANGGIGFASNQAIAMTRGIYVGQLDSDDRLKPGAVNRLATYLDENPAVVCCYGSCERVDAEGGFVKNEYSWPVFSREKMMTTSIAHHFRMFRKQAWERTEKFREDIVNAVDYDIFLKMSEVGQFHHIDEVMYQRRWHGANTSNVNEDRQTANTYRVQREALTRMGLSGFWNIHVADPQQPRKVGYRRQDGRKLVTFWPNYSQRNPYQRLLYGADMQQVEFCAGTIDAALRAIETSHQPETHVFHLHWLNFLFVNLHEESAAREAADELLRKMKAFKDKGGSLIWTIHNVVSHDTQFWEVEKDLSCRLTDLVDVLHFHNEASISEVEDAFPIPRHKVRITRHGNYIGAYPNFVPREAARHYLGVAPTDDVILFNGQVRGYKGIDTLIDAFRKVLADRKTALLMIAGTMKNDPLAEAKPPLSDFERSRIIAVDRFIDESELQIFLKGADFAIYPYRNILTSGSLMLALTFGLPVVVPDVGMTRDVLGDGAAGLLYDGNGGAAALEAAIRTMLKHKDRGRLQEMADAASEVAADLSWTNLF